MGLQVAFSRVWNDIFSQPRCSDGMGTVFFSSLMHSICPRDLNSAPCNPCWYTRKAFFLSDAFHMSRGPEFCPLQPLLVYQEIFFRQIFQSVQF